MHSSLLRRGLVFAALIVFAPLGHAAPTKPALPAKVNQLIDVLFRSQEFEQGQLSPDGARFAYIRQVKDQKVLDSYEFKTGKFYRMKPPSGPSSRLLPGVEQNIGNFYWIGPNQLLIQDNVHNLGFSGLWVADGNLQNCCKLDSGNRYLIPLITLPQNPDTAFLREVPEKTLFTPLWRLNKKTLSVYEAEGNPGRVIAWHLDQGGQIRLATVAENEGRTSYLYRLPGAKAWEPVSLPNLSEPVTFDATGQNVLVAYQGPGGRGQLRSFDLSTKQFSGEPIADAVYDINPAVIHDPRTGTPIGLVYETDRPVIFWLNPQYSQVYATLHQAFPSATVLPRGVLQSGEILFSVSSDVQPPVLYRFDAQKREVHAVISALPEAARMKWAPMQPVTFPSRDGTTIHAYLTLPSGRQPGQKVPLVALSHGGPEVRDGWGFDPEVQFLAALGYGVLQVNYRGSIGYGHDYALKNSVEVCEKSVDDVVDGIRWTIAGGHADPARIAAYGGSYGGYISLGIATRYPDLLAASVGFAGVYDWEAQLKETHKHAADLLRWRADYYIDSKTHGVLYRPFNPAGTAAKVRCPVLLLHGGSDRTVDINQTNIMSRALRDAGKSVEVVKDAEGIHGLPNEAARRNFYSTIAAFLLKHVPPDPAP